ncbi:MAG: hypothetical protein AABZ55_07015 [Bdellovibrionota bacterium]
MSVSFKSPDGSSHDSGICEPKLNLLAHAQAIELDIGSECGGHGICGKDRVLIPKKIMNMFSMITEAERHHFSDAELGAGWRLSCQCFPNRGSLNCEILIQK